MKNKIKFRRAFELLINQLPKCFPELTNHDELPAMITHWLFDSETPPPFFKQKYAKQAKEIIGSIAGCPTDLNDADLESRESAPGQILFDIIAKNVPFPPPDNPKFTFIDLFAGIGGIRTAFQNVEGKCVFSSEWNKYAKMTYETNFGEVPYGDIKKIDENTIPEHDVLCAGFPCQPFSLAGVSKKNSLGIKHGFDDPTQGTLFFDIKRILIAKRPKAFFLENVKNLLHHDKGRTWEVIRSTLEDELGYVINWKVVDAAKWLPQHRERIFIVGYDPRQIPLRKEDIDIPPAPTNGYVYPELNKIVKKEADPKFTLGPGTWATLERHKAHHAAAGNGFGYGLHKLPIAKGVVTRTISARYHKDGAEILVEQPSRERPRKLTVEEAMQLQGFDPRHFVFPVSATQAYKQIGNSVAVPAVEASAQQIAYILKEWA